MKTLLDFVTADQKASIGELKFRVPRTKPSNEAARYGVHASALNRQSFIPTCADHLARTLSRFSNMRTVRDCGSSIVNNRPGPAVSPVDPSSAPIRPGPALQDISIFPRRNLEAERILTVVSIPASFSRKMELQDPQVSKSSGVGTITQ
ncbi:uncharacterized protein APUU_21666S [Aspergillus puulaauensis]|uniref:Uncharacterized protein n=1 Tax=Aspergillus puulaauensis TaxID=1220207 RepID=A0A7R8AIY6_9EURO|nr:uncharacterized protein APUU_21666S [Aspergillus puulaauensis]BCS21234.1 hypothetical protein APUU_21666S [Aspergillus puulaauensis]